MLRRLSNVERRHSQPDRRLSQAERRLSQAEPDRRLSQAERLSLQPPPPPPPTTGKSSALATLGRVTGSAFSNAADATNRGARRLEISAEIKNLQSKVARTQEKFGIKLFAAMLADNFIEEEALLTVTKARIDALNEEIEAKRERQSDLKHRDAPPPPPEFFPGAPLLPEGPYTEARRIVELEAELAVLKQQPQQPQQPPPPHSTPGPPGPPPPPRFKPVRAILHSTPPPPPPMWQVEVGGAVEARLNAQGILVVMLQHASGLKPMDRNGSSDPYAKLSLAGGTRTSKVVSQRPDPAATLCNEAGDSLCPGCSPTCPHSPYEEP
eukprot:scaffold52681_cov69-Phaeocystis_antarctica.AAC.5